MLNDDLPAAPAPVLSDKDIAAMHAWQIAMRAYSREGAPERVRAAAARYLINLGKRRA